VIKILEINKIYNMDNIEGMRLLDDNCIDLTVTSPPYDNLRTYKGFSWDFEGVANELYRVTKEGGVVVWVVGDATINGSETGTSFRQALYFMDIGFNLHDTMIYEKTSPYPANVRYQQDFEYMFVFSKGKPNTFNPIHTLKTLGEIKKILRGSYDHSTRTYRSICGETERLDEAGLKRLEKASKNITKVMSNVWKCEAGYQKSTTDEIAYKHPAIFPEQLAQDHIISWSNENDTVLDCFMGSGTTIKMAKILNRNFIGIEKEPKYYEIAKKRIESVTAVQMELKGV
jgi:site-specific DNA-methyltransferase (adenine-specific)